MTPIASARPERESPPETPTAVGGRYGSRGTVSRQTVTAATAEAANADPREERRGLLPSGSWRSTTSRATSRSSASTSRAPAIASRARRAVRRRWRPRRGRARPDRARRDAPRDRRVRGAAARSGAVELPGDHADRERRRGGQGARPATRGRRLRDEAVLGAGAARPRRGGAPACASSGEQRAGARRRSRSGISRSTGSASR